MRYIHNHIKKIIETYEGEIPLNLYLKNYFKKHPILGSRDRKMLSEMAFAWYRCSKAFAASLSFEKKLERIITQKWIASWSMATEAWFDWRRTGYPELHGVAGFTKAPELPLRFYYPLGERNLNANNVEAASNNLETTSYSNFGGNGAKNSPWSKPWIVQGTGKPW